MLPRHFQVVGTCGYAREKIANSCPPNPLISNSNSNSNSFGRQKWSLKKGGSLF